MRNSDVLRKPVGQAGQADLIAGVLCLDFVNTVEPRIKPRYGGDPRDYLTTYRDLIEWSQHTAILSDREAQTLLGAAENHPNLIQVALSQAVTLREVIYQIFFAIAQHQPVEVDQLAALSSAYAEAMTHMRVTPIEDGFKMTWTGTSSDFTRPLWPIAQSAMDLLLRGEVQRIKDCPSGEDGCGWLFYDTSKNNSRRWCSMKSCGAPAKERRRGKRVRNKTQ